MARQKQTPPVRIELTEQQKAKLRMLTGKDIGELEFSVMELEERIAPAMSRN